MKKTRTERFASVAELACALAPFGPETCAASVERVTAVVAGSTRAVAPGPVTHAVDARDIPTEVDETNGGDAALAEPDHTPQSHLWMAAAAALLVVGGGSLLARGIDAPGASWRATPVVYAPPLRPRPPAASPEAEPASAPSSSATGQPLPVARKRTAPRPGVSASPSASSLPPVPKEGPYDARK